MRKINMADPHFSEDDRKKIHRELDFILDNSLSMGPHVKAFEQEFSGRVGVKHAIAMNSGTSALESALLAIGVEEREVIVPTETFIATGMAVHLSGGKPIFAEISDKTFCLDLEDVKRKVTSKTVGIILVHMAGLITPDIYKFKQFCDDNGLFLIEDAAHAPGASIDGQEAGSFGHVGCFSFFPSKVVTAGEGGMLTTNDDAIANFSRSYQHRGRDLSSSIEVYSMPGRNVRMTEVAALLGRIQFDHLDDYLSARQQVALIYQRELQGHQHFSLISPQNIKSSSCWKVLILLDEIVDRGAVVKIMTEAGVSVDFTYHPALHLQPVFRNLYGTSEGMLPVSEDLLSRHLCLPCHQRMTVDDARYVSETLLEAIEQSKTE